jgi:hypothetical protein
MEEDSMGSDSCPSEDNLSESELAKLLPSKKDKTNQTIKPLQLKKKNSSNNDN